MSINPTGHSLNHLNLGPQKAKDTQENELGQREQQHQVEKNRAELQLSSTLQDIAHRIDNTPDIDQKKIDKIKTALANGEYDIDPARIAEKFLDFETQLP